MRYAYTTWFILLPLLVFVPAASRAGGVIIDGDYAVTICSEREQSGPEEEPQDCSPPVDITKLTQEELQLFIWSVYIYEGADAALELAHAAEKIRRKDAATAAPEAAQDEVARVAEWVEYAESLADTGEGHGTEDLQQTDSKPQAFGCRAMPGSSLLGILMALAVIRRRKQRW